MVTRADVARLAGTSTAVVSYVLNDGPRPVAPSTRQRVLDAVEELGYRPNQIARALSNRRSNTIGLIVPDICNPYFAELARAIEDEAVARGYLLLLGNSAGSAVREAEYARTFLERQVDGVLLISVQEDPDLASFHDQGIRVVVLHDVSDAQAASTIAIDDEAGTYTATAHLIEHGHRDLAFVNGTTEFAVAVQRQRGFDRAVRASRGVRGRTVTADFTRAAAYEAALKLLAGPSRPTAVVAASDEQAFGVMAAAHRLGLAIPEDLAVVGFDGTAQGEYSNPPLTSVCQPVADIRRLALDLVTGIDEAPAHHVLPHALVLRHSCGCAAAGR
jgi:LacI family transcriptional regulator